LGIEGIPSLWVSIASPEFLLKEGKSRQVTLAIEPECDAKVKEYSFKIRAGIRGTSFSTQKTGKIVLEDSQPVAIIAPGLSACNDSETSAEVRIKNNGRLQDGLKLSVTGQKWIEVNPDEITLDAGEEGKAKLVFRKNAKAAGQYSFTLKAYSEKFGKGTEVQLSASLQDCFDISVESFTVNGAVSQAPTVCLEEKPVYAFSLQNTGNEAVGLNAIVDGLDAVAMPGKIAMAKGETKELTVELDLENEEPGDKDFSLVLQSDNFSLSKEFTLKAVDCYALDVDFSELEAGIALDANCKSEAFTVKVKNTGTREQTVSVSVQGPGWISFEPVRQAVSPGSSKEVYFYMSPPYDVKEGKHTATAVAQPGGSVTQFRRGTDLGFRLQAGRGHPGSGDHKKCASQPR